MTDSMQYPEVAPPVWENIPPELVALQQWLLWKFEPPKKGATKPAKMPYYLSGGRRAGTQGSDEDRDKLATLDAVRRRYERGGYAGIGFAFLPGDGLIGIDIDGAIDGETGEVSSRCLEIISACNSFTERSPSGRGVHIIVKGETVSNKDNGIGLEMFCGAQFFTFTARRWEGTPATVNEIDARTLGRLNATINQAKAHEKARKAARAAAEASAKKAPEGGRAPDGPDDFARVKKQAMDSLSAWVPQLLPAVKPYRNGYRISSADLGRDLQEDLSIQSDGIRDFGEEEALTPIDLVMRWLPTSKPHEALAWLAQRLGIAIGERRDPQKTRATLPASAGNGSGQPPDGGGGGGGGGRGAEDEEDDAADESPVTLLMGKGKKPEDCRENVLYCFRRDPVLKGLVALNQFTEQQDKTRAPPWGGEPGEWSEEDDLMLGEYLARVHRLLIKGVGTIRAGVQMAARENKHHPIVERLRAVPWDGTRRLEHWMVDCLGVVDRPYVRMISRFFIMGMVARVIRPGCKFDYMVIFQGLQGLGKSTAFKALASPYFMDTPFRIGDKDSYLSLQGVWLVEFSELENMSKAESTAIKAFVSSTEDRFRPPYGHRMVKMPRRAVLCGTTNSDQFLKDSTGDRRMWPVQATDPRPDLLEAVRDQLYAEALHWLEKGTPEEARYYPTRAEEKEFFQPEQDRWRMVDVWTDILADYVNKELVVIKQADPDAPPPEATELAPAKRGFFTAQELFARALFIKAERMDNAKLMQTRIGGAMREIGFISAREPTGSRKRGYLRPGWEFAEGGKVRKIPGWVDPASPQAQEQAVPPPTQSGGDDGPPLPI